MTELKSFLAALALILALASPIASAHGSNEGKPVSGARPESVRLAEELSVELVQARAAHARAGRSDRAARLATVEEIAHERHDLLALLMESDPGEVLRLAMPKNMQVAFPASARRYFETEVTEATRFKHCCRHATHPGQELLIFARNASCPTT